jgi:hypothetical protein
VVTGGDEVRVEVIGVFEQEQGPSAGEVAPPVLVLRDGSGRELFLPTSQCEGLAIHLVLQEHVVARPLTHDLGIRIMEKLSTTVERVVIDDFSDDTYYASIHLVSRDGPLSVPARPGDAVALALRAEASVFVTERILSRSGQLGGDSL